MQIGPLGASRVYSCVAYVLTVVCVQPCVHGFQARVVLPIALLIGWVEDVGRSGGGRTAAHALGCQDQLRCCKFLLLGSGKCGLVLLVLLCIEVLLWEGSRAPAVTHVYQPAGPARGGHKACLHAAQLRNTK